MRSKFLIIAIPLAVLLAGAVAYRYGYLEIRSRLTQVQEEQGMKNALIEKYVNLIAAIPGLERELAFLKEANESYREELVEGETDAIAAASLQDTVKGIITGRGGKISKERIGPVLNTGNLKVINVSLDAGMPDVRALSDSLHAIETHTPFIYVKNLNVRIRDYKDPRELTVTLEVAALTAGK